MRVLDRELLLDTVEGDRALLAEVVDIFFETSTESLDTIRSAAREQDARRVQESAHKLKGALANLGALAAAEAAAQLESRSDANGDVASAIARLETEIRRLTPELRDLARPGDAG